MPGYKTHLVGGAFVFFILFALLGTSISMRCTTLIEWLLCALLGSLFPDVDTKSKGQKIFYQLLAIVYCMLAFLQRWTSIIMLSFFALLPLLVHHRGLFHKAWFVALLGCCATIYCAFYAPSLMGAVAWDGLFFVAGAWSHLVLDRGFKRAFKW